MDIQADYSPSAETELCGIMKAVGADIANDMHNYTTLYGNVFNGVRDQPIRLLQFGLDCSATLAGWRTYFTHPDAFIAGIDRDLSSNLPAIEGAHTFSFSWSDPSGLDLFWECIDKPFDIIIDSGNWNPADKALLFALHAQHMTKGGVYIIQNIHWRESVHWMSVKQRWDKEFPGIQFRFLSIPHPVNRDNNIVILAHVKDATMVPYVPTAKPTEATVVETSAGGNQIVE
jgi:hypothetical protein